jgi:lysozyme
MELSSTGLNLIKQSEGFRSARYLDVAGKPTIGYGHLLEPGETYTVITEAQATQLLIADVAWAQRAVSTLVRVTLTQGQYDALVDFTYNLGEGTLEHSTLLRLLNAGNYSSAGEQLLEWTHAGGKVEPGLVTRRQAELQLWNAA